MKIVILDAMTLGSDIDLSKFEQLGEVVRYETSTQEEAAKRLEADGIHARVIDMSLAIKPCDREAVIKAARETGRIITVEEHSRYGGLGGLVAEIVCEEVPGTEMTILGIPDENAVHGTDKEIRHYYGLDADGIYAAAKE